MPTIEQTSKPARIALVLATLLFAFVAAVAARPAVVLAAPVEEAPPQLSFDPGSYDFGLQQVNSGAGQANLQLRNAGSEAVQVNSLEIAGPDTEAFWFDSNCFGMTLQPSETCSVQVYFSPRDSRDYAVQLRANVGSYSFSADLTGTGGRAVLAPASNPTDFGVAPVGSAGTTREVVISNVGNLPGGAFIAVIAGGAVGSFQLLDENCTGHLLTPAATCTLQVRFRPLSEGVKTATLGLFGDQDGGTQVLLTGVGTSPDPTASPDSPASAALGGAAAGPTAQQRSRSRKRRLRTHRRHPRVAVGASRLTARAK